ncbi:MAG: BamA/TamA family outer membrane protein [Pseudomonadota bacterium]
MAPQIAVFFAGIVRVAKPSIEGCVLRKSKGLAGIVVAFLIATTGFVATTVQANAENFKAVIEGAPSPLGATLRTVSSLTNGSRTAPTASAARRLAKNDVAALTQAMKAAGYYAAEANFRLEDDGDKDRRVVFEVTPGAAFKIRTYELVYTDDQEDGQEDGRPDSLEALNVAAADGAAGATIAATQAAVLSALRNNGYPNARAIGRRVRADLAAGTATAIVEFESGQRAVFGDAEVSGLEKTNEAYLQRLKNWEVGAPFDLDTVIAYRDRLGATGLFSDLDVTPGARDETGVAPVLVTVSERKRRTIGGGVTFSTVEGPGGRLFFEQRNVFGAGEIARAEINATQIQQSLLLDLNKPMPGFPGAAFGQASLINQTTESFDALTIAVAAGLSKRWLDDRLTTQAGVAFETARITQDGVSERTFLVSAPLSAIWNTETDPLALSRGALASLSATPFTGSDTFTQFDFNARSRVNFGAATIAGRTRLGATVGASLDDLPLTQRFFAGGGSSVRGFGFQEAGPLDEEERPIGGRSIFEAAVEARYKVFGPVQLAAFIEAANISEGVTPDFGGDYFVGVGGGARYITPIGPIRLDIAFPLEKRETDASFQLFVSLGQPF